MDIIIQDASEEFEKTYETFDNKPDFERDVYQNGNEIIGTYFTEGEGSSSNPYPFLVRGTKVRYATMSSDFEAKTKPGIIGSGPGAGRMLYVNKNRPRPGIEAREFDKVIAKLEQKRLKQIAKEYEKKMATQSGHAL